VQHEDDQWKQQAEKDYIIEVKAGRLSIQADTSKHIINKHAATARVCQDAKCTIVSLASVSKTPEKAEVNHELLAISWTVEQLWLVGVTTPRPDWKTYLQGSGADQ